MRSTEDIQAIIDMALKHRIRSLTVDGVGLEFRDDAFPPLEPAARVQPQTDEDRRKAEERHHNLRRYGSSRG